MSAPERLRAQDAEALHLGRCATRISEYLAEAIFQQKFSSLSYEDQASLLMIAARTVQAVEERGWQMVFNSDGSYGWVVT